MAGNSAEHSNYRLQCLFQGAAGTGQVDPLEALPAAAEHGSIVQPDLGPPQNPFLQLLITQAQRPQIDPYQIGSLQGVNSYGGKMTVDILNGISIYFSDFEYHENFGYEIDGVLLCYDPV